MYAYQSQYLPMARGNEYKYMALCMHTLHIAHILYVYVAYAAGVASH